MSPKIELPRLLEGKTEESRLRIASEVGELLSAQDIPAAERRAAETLARRLVADAIEQVRRELSKAVRHAKYLPREVAFKIAHDVESVAAPFLEVTEVFSDSDWQQLVLTLSRSARISVAGRASMSDGLALALTEVGDSVVAETLVENPAAPMTAPVCHSLIERFGETTWIMDKLSERASPSPEIAIRLFPMVSAAARKKLSSVYHLTDFTDPIGVEVEQAALLRLVRQVPEAQLVATAEGLRRDGVLNHVLLLHALRDGQLSFVAAGLAALGKGRFESALSTVHHGGAAALVQLLREAGIPGPAHDSYWDALQAARSKLETAERAASA